MTITRAKKETQVAELESLFDKHQYVVLVENKGLSVKQVDAFRVKARTVEVTYRIAKNTLSVRAAKGRSAEKLSDLFSGPLGIAAHSDNPIGVAKLVVDFAKDNPQMVVRGALVDGAVLDAKGVESLAKMPGLNELRAGIVGLLQAPLVKLVRLTREPGRRVATVISEHGKQN